MAKNTLVITEKHRHALRQVVEVFCEKRFRRSDLSERIYPMTSPRSRERADAISDRVLREAAAAGKIRREGHQHWAKVGHGRTLIDGSTVAELAVPQELKLDTKCPAKWLAVDLETGDVWRGTTSGWKRLEEQRRQTLLGLLGSKP
ncbi:hypothetical protein Q5W_21885 [Hydrogenophaga sp. PBC]|nr:hypothetical protein Q5W_21885 [Hydrogenophaga sp. PBC]